jgi:DNA-binding NtrC family response regulator
MPVARILVIDDAADMRALLEQALQSAGHEVVLAADGREGMEQYRTKRPQLVITDLYMPNQAGLETIVQLHKESPGVQIIAMCGKATAMPMLSAAERLGAVAVLQKPFATEELLAAVESALRSESRPA